MNAEHDHMTTEQAAQVLGISHEEFLAYQKDCRQRQKQIEEIDTMTRQVEAARQMLQALLYVKRNHHEGEGYFETVVLEAITAAQEAGL